TVGELELGRTVTVATAALQEDISRGQAVARYELTGSNGGAWESLGGGTTIGYKKIDRFAPTAVRRLRLEIRDSLRRPAGIRVALY
ncbi:MAG TPA: hypothetical protein VF187_04790, partial [Gemmatimonadales bacterium]